ncbi:globin family protein [Acaryochloris marina]|uniref:Globin domain protein n=1 Tax=Acaryochloris marina (strain MBIC 11017) TaxID=329726 RepID=B0C7N8_ACAM1|nr:globin family protein [Acaryochloris marina]ABW25298.1 globin domain protein [Acaryochloris marina MBIC11017]
MALQTELLTNSFDLLRENEAEFTQVFYGTLFTDYPQVKPLFSNTHMDEQAKKLFASLLLVVNNLTKPDALSSALKGLGTRHVKYGVLPEHYPLVGSTLLKSMAATLKDQWTPDIEAAWTDAYGAITEIMLEGTDYPEEVLISESMSAT